MSNKMTGTASKNKAGFSRPWRVASPGQALVGPAIAPRKYCMTTSRTTVQARDQLEAHRLASPLVEPSTECPSTC